jgi:pimeloyl-ACP methyl ester carboxylesterase
MAHVKPTAHSVVTRAGTLRVHAWEPLAQAAALTIVTVHPWATLGGSEYNTRGVAAAFAAKGYRALSFDMSSSNMVWGVLTNHARETRQISDVCAWARDQWPTSGVLLFGSSAGATQASSALAQSEHVLGIACVGYTWGNFASIAFGRHHSNFLTSTKPRLLITGDSDEFTSVATLERMVAKAQASGPIESIIVPDVGHFELEAPGADSAVADFVVQWIRKIGFSGPPTGGGGGTCSTGAPPP